MGLVDVKAGPFRYSSDGVAVCVGTRPLGLHSPDSARARLITLGRGGLTVRSFAGVAAEPGPQLQGRIDDADVVAGTQPMVAEPEPVDCLVGQLNQAASVRQWWWLAALVAAVAGALTWPYGVAAWVVAVPLCWWWYQRTMLRRTVVVLYDADEQARARFDDIIEAWSRLRQSDRLWRSLGAADIGSAGPPAASAGADERAQRIPLTASLKGARWLATNLKVPTLSAGDAALYFLPDRVLVRQARTFGELSYARLGAAAGDQRCVELPGTQPRDSIMLAYSWKYVDRDGRPDQRYPDNPRRIVMLYGILEITGEDWLHWRIHTSRPEAAQAVSRVLVPASRPGSLP
ncbi:MAG: hypothetical protein ACK5KO_06200, partial [Arachnia sp.]